MITRDRKRTPKRPGSNFVLAIALMSGTAMLAGALEAPAQAQRDKKKKKKKQDTDNSKEFVNVYTPANALMQAEAPDVAAAKAAMPGVLAAVSTPYDKRVAGGFVFNIGIVSDDKALQRQGYDMIIDSGTLAEEELPKYYYNAGQLAYADDDFDTTIARFLQASEAGYAVPNLHDTVARLYFQQDRYADGFAYLRTVVDDAVAKNETPDESLVKLAYSVAYNNDIQDQALAWTVTHVEFFPTDANWVNVIAMRREYFDENPKMILDLLRLQGRAAGLKNDRDYVNYIEVTGLFPVERKRIVDEGIQSGVLQANSVVVEEARANLSAKISEVREDMPALESDARAAGSSSGLATSTADGLLSIGEAARAEEVYAIALTRPGVETDYVMTRMGIAQIEQNKAAEAKATFAKVGDSYRAVAELWEVYADRMANAAPATAEVAATTM